MTRAPGSTLAGDQIALLGTGIMGGAMARNLLAAGLPVSVWNRSAESMRALQAQGARCASCPADAVRGADVVITMLSDGGVVKQVMAEALVAMEPGALWIQMSTVGAESIRELSALAAAAGIDFVDAPVLGTRQPAEAGTLTIVAAGEPPLAERCKVVFAAVGERTVWVGRAGAASKLKLVANQWSTGMVALLSETITLARALGVEPRSFLHLVDGGVFMAPYAEGKARMMLSEEFTPCFPLDLAHKDVRLVLDAARRADQHVPVTEAIERQYDVALRRGRGRDDLSAVITALGR
ncbi:MAG: NAD(P)-dependent oxidoreductase [Polyangiales bacterium]